MFLCCTTNCLSLSSAAVIKATDAEGVFQLGLWPNVAISSDVSVACIFGLTRTVAVIEH